MERKGSEKGEERGESKSVVRGGRQWGEGKERKERTSHGRGGHHMVQPTQHVDGEGGGGAPNLTRVAPT